MSARVVSNDRDVKIPVGSSVGIDRITPANALLTAPAHGRYYELCRQGNLFWAGNMAGAAHAYSVALTTTYTGLCLSNPIGNSKDIVIEAWGFSAGLAYVALSMVGIMGGYSTTECTHTTPGVFDTDFGCLNLGSKNSPTCLMDEHATIVTPRLLMALGHEAIATAVGAGSAAMIDIGGAIRLQPGGWCATYCLTAITGNSCFWWSEDPR